MPNQVKSDPEPAVPKPKIGLELDLESDLESELEEHLEDEPELVSESNL